MSSKASAVAHPIQGLIKYHGLRNKLLRLPYHDSISVCMAELYTRTTVDLTNLGYDVLLINGRRPELKEEVRMKSILDRVRELSGRSDGVIAISENIIGGQQFSYDLGKGLGYSSSGGAALAAAAAKAFDLDDLVADKKRLSAVARRLAGSAARSVAGGFARWYASEVDESSFAEQIAGPNDLPEFKMVVYPIRETSGLKTERAHPEVESSPLFEGRLKYIDKALTQMMEAISKKDVDQIGRLAEKDSLVLHAVTSTGDGHMVAVEPDSIRIFKTVKRLREERGVKAYVSWDTGPSTFVNTEERFVDEVVAELSKVVDRKPVVCSVGREVELSDQHLF